MLQPTILSPATTPEAAAAAARERATRSMRGLSELLAQRPELRGVHAPADLTDEALRWSA
jgi:hypothetical protein